MREPSPQRNICPQSSAANNMAKAKDSGGDGHVMPPSWSASPGVARTSCTDLATPLGLTTEQGVCLS